MENYKSNDSIKAFFTLLITYFILSGGLLGLHLIGICNFQSDLTSIENFIFSLPMISLYLLIFLAATAGYARGKYMLEKLPLSAHLKQELDERNMNSASIKTKIRAGSQISLNDSFSDVVNNMVSSRIPILAVVDDQNDVSGVITATDLLLYIQKLFNDNKEDLKSLKETKVKTIKSSTQLVSVKANDKLQMVTEAMIMNQCSKLIVTKDCKKNGKIFSGTIDALDVLAELLDNHSS